MASPEENKAAAEKRAADNRELAAAAAAAGNTAKAEMYAKRAETWDASANRYAGIINAKERIATAKTNLEEIKKRIENIKSSSESVVVIPPIIPKATCPPGYRMSPDGDCVEIQRRSGNSTPPTPVSPPPPAPMPPPPPVKTAPIDTVMFNDEAVPIEFMADLILEDIGGHELINIVRNDTINGQKVNYLPIKNISSINQQYDPNNILSLQDTADKYFGNFTITLDDKIPELGSGPNGSHIYIDQGTGNLIIELINLLPDNEIQVSFMTNGTIYEAEFNES